jgi:thiol-disulfide isomerase/thioredoxin
VAGSLVVVIVAAVVIALLASDGGDSSGPESAGRGKPVQVAPVKVSGATLPAFPTSGTDKAVGSTIPTLSGSSLFDGADLTIAPTGKPQMVSFLAHWCPHCQAEVPVIVSLGKKGSLDGVDVSGVATGTSPERDNYPPSAWLEREGWKYPTMADSSSSTAAQAYGLTGYPMLVFVDAQGKVAGRSEGEISASDLAAVIDALKAGRALPLPTAGASSSAR